MKYLLDTDTLSLLYDAQREPYHSKIYEKLSNLDESDTAFVSVLSICELEYSHANSSKSKKEKLRNTIEKITEDFDIIPVHLDIAFNFGILKKSINDKGDKSRDDMKEQ